MVSYCCICRRKYDKNNGISFHAFPKSKERRAAWEIACKLEKPAPASIQICSEHFTPDSFMPKRFYGIKLLKLSAIPSRFPWNKENNLAASNFEDHTYAQCDTTSVSSDKRQEYGIEIVSSSCSIPSQETCNLPKIIAIENPSFQIYSPPTQCNTTVLNQPPECELEIATSSCEISVQTEEECELPCTNGSTILYLPHPESNTTLVLNQDQECEREVTVPSTEHNLPKATTEDASIQIHPPSSSTSKWQSEVTNEPVKKRRIWRPARIGDLAPEHFSTPRKAAMNIEMIRKKNLEKSLKIKVLQTQNNRLLKRLKVLEDLIADLEDNDLIPETLKLKRTKARGLMVPRTNSSLARHERRKT